MLTVDWKKEDLNNYRFVYSGKSLEPSLSVYESGLLHDSIIYLTRKKQIIGGYSPYEKEINIKFIKISDEYCNKIPNCQLNNLLN